MNAPLRSFDFARPPVFRGSFDPSELIVDSFAGGGGASTGIAAALGRSPDVAINHSEEAIAVHTANHPETDHYREDIFAVDPSEVVRKHGGRRIGLAHFSPDCTHFSKAKGGQPRSKEVRGLANVVINWAEKVRPRVIVLENVEEFQTWGPLDDDGYPIKTREGEDFRAWLARLVELGYEVDFRLLVAADYGTPTTRKRLFLVARCDGQPIVWPDATHGKGREKPWRTAAEIIDWSMGCPSIFGRKRPLAPATMKRIAAGLKRYVIDAPRPFVVKYHGGERGHTRGQVIEEPLRTVDTENRFGLVTPFVSPVKTWGGGGNGARSIEEPMRTVTASKRGEFALVSPTLIQTGYGERTGQAPRVPGLHKPLGTVVAGGQKHAVVAAFLAKHYGGVVGHGVDRTLGTVTTVDHHSLVTAQLEPKRGQLKLPGTYSREDRDELAASFVTKFYGTSTGVDVESPLPTVTGQGQHLAEVRAFLIAYYGSESEGQSTASPLRTVTTRDRFGLVVIEGQEYAITDIGLRMLSPRELFNAQGFPGDYIIDPVFRGKPLTKTSQIELAGNSVCSQVERAVVMANVYGRAVA